MLHAAPNGAGGEGWLKAINMSLLRSEDLFQHDDQNKELDLTDKVILPPCLPTRLTSQFS